MFIFLFFLFIVSPAGEDYMPRNITLSLQELLGNDFIIPIINDNDYEGDSEEKFLVMASVVSGSRDGRILIQPSSIEIAIRDDDPKPRE